MVLKIRVVKVDVVLVDEADEAKQEKVTEDKDEEQATLDAAHPLSRYKEFLIFVERSHFVYRQLIS